jgi:endo-1,4-beta-xylanase
MIMQAFVADDGSREIVEPQQNVFNFTQAETIVSWAEKNDFHIRGHTLVWHSQPAPWVTQLTGKALEKAILNHVVMGNACNNRVHPTYSHSHLFSVMTQFRGRIDHWDVLNEAFEGTSTDI